MNIALIDVDGTLAKRDACWSQLANNNENAKTTEFLDKLAKLGCNHEVVRHISLKRFDLKVLVTGRLDEHYMTTMDWCKDVCGLEMDSLMTVPWDDTFATRDESYADYVKKKVAKLLAIGNDFIQAYANVDISCDVVVYEDDELVVKQLAATHMPAPGRKNWRIYQVINEKPVEY
jgi:hypothetical protein